MALGFLAKAIARDVMARSSQQFALGISGIWSMMLLFINLLQSEKCNVSIGIELRQKNLSQSPMSIIFSLPLLFVK